MFPGVAYFLLPLQFSLYIPFLGIYYRPWRLLTLALALPMGVGALMLAYLYESPKFLASRGYNKKALEVLKNIYAWNGGNKEEYPVSVGTSRQGRSASVFIFKMKQFMHIFFL